MSCTECGRPICTECLRMTPVGPRCPDHATQGKPRLRAPTRQRAARRAISFRTNEPYVTWTLVALNVAVYLITVAQGAGINSPGGKLFEQWDLYGYAVHNGGWWRLITAAFLHANIVHIGLNMLALVWLGGPVERYIGPLRYLGLYVVSGLAGSAGALVVTPNSPTVGASGAIFGILGALFVLERKGSIMTGGQVAGLIVLNLIFTFAVSNISVGGHVGGLIGGVVLMWLFVHTRRSAAQSIAATAAVVVASVIVAYAKVRGYS